MKLTFEELPGVVQEIRDQLNRIEHQFKNQYSTSKPDPDKKYLFPEAASYCMMATPTLRKHLKDGKVVGSKPGRSWIFLQKDLDEFLARYRSKSVEELKEQAEKIII